MGRLLLTLALGAAYCISAFAQTAEPTKPPDFSGTWKLNLAKSKLDKHNTVASETLVITSTDSSLEFHYATNEKDYTYQYITDGRKRPRAEIIGKPQRSPYLNVLVTAQWKKSVLVVEELARRADESQLPIRTDRWSLSGDGDTLTKDSNAEISFVYDKQ